MQKEGNIFPSLCERKGLLFLKRQRAQWCCRYGITLHTAVRAEDTTAAAPLPPHGCLLPPIARVYCPQGTLAGPHVPHNLQQRTPTPASLSHQ